MEMIGKVRRMHRRDKKSVREIAKATGLSRNTVAKWLQASVEDRPKYRRTLQPTKLTPFHEAIKQALTVDARRPKRERRTALALHAELKAAGYEGGYSRLNDFIRAWREGVGQTLNATAFVPLAFDLGEAFQFDRSEEGLVIAGVYRRVQLAHMKLCASRAFWLVAYPSQGHEMLFDAHARGFAALGIARRGIYDNMKTAVDKVNKGKGRVVNSRFAVMCAHYLVDADFCNVASGWDSKRSAAAAKANLRSKLSEAAAATRASSRRTCRTAAGACGSKRASGAGAASKNSMRGSGHAAVSCGRRSATPSTAPSASPRCSSTSARS